MNILASGSRYQNRPSWYWPSTASMWINMRYICSTTQVSVEWSLASCERQQFYSRSQYIPSKRKHTHKNMQELTRIKKDHISLYQVKRVYDQQTCFRPQCTLITRQNMFKCKLIQQEQEIITKYHETLHNI